MSRKRSIQMTVYLTPEQSDDYTEYARQFNISKSELFTRSVDFCLAHTNESGIFVAPQFSVDKVVDRMVSAVIEKAKKEGILVVDSLTVKPDEQN